MSKKINKKNYAKKIKDNIDRFTKNLNKSLNLGLNSEFRSTVLKFYFDILFSIQPKSKESSFGNFYQNLPIKRTEYLSASLIYYLLNYSDNPITIKITDFEEITKLHRQNIRKVLDYIAELSKNLRNYNFNYSKRETYRFNISKYLSDLNSYIKNIITELVRKKRLNLEISTEEIKEIINLYMEVINNIKSKTEKGKIQEFYNSLDSKVRDPKYLAATLCYMHLRFHKDFYIKQKEFVNIINELLNYELAFDSFSRTYSNFYENHFRIDQKSYQRKVSHYLSSYITRINNLENFKLNLTSDFKGQAMLLYKLAVSNGFDIADLSKNLLSFTESKKYFPQHMAASLIYLTLKKNREFVNTQRETT